MKNNNRSNRPNVLLIVLDTTRFDHLSCYGYHRKTSPVIDQIAAEGVLYENGFTTASWTLPSHASMFTGMYSSKHGANNLHQVFDCEYPTLAEVLLKEGYRTAAISNNPFVSRQVGMDRGFDIFEEIWLSSGISKFLKKGQKGIEKLLGKRDKGGREILARAGHWFDVSRQDDRPLFLFLNILEPHLDYKPPRPFDEIFLPVGVDPGKVKALNHDPAKYISGEVKMSPEELELMTSLYDAEIYYTDTILGNFFQSIPKSQLDDTLIIIVGDHGDLIGEQNLLGHEFSLAEPLIHVPFILRWPNGLDAGVSVKNNVQIVDIFPTVTDLLNIENPNLLQEIQGQSVVPSKLSPAEERMVFAELFRQPKMKLEGRYPDINLPMYRRDIRVVRGNRYKYIWSSEGEHKLFDLDQDPQELTDIRSKQPSIANEYQNILDEWLKSFERRETLEADMVVDDVTNERLRALGYIN